MARDAIEGYVEVMRESGWPVRCGAAMSTCARWTSTGGCPRIEVYAVVLQAIVEGEWRAVRLIDNRLDQHHMHRCDGSRKGTPEHVAYGTVHEVIPQAIRYMRDHYEPNRGIHDRPSHKSCRPSRQRGCDQRDRR